MTLALALPRARLRPPPERPTAIARPRLHERFDAAVRFPVTLVAAPAGYGKSTAVAQWARARGRPPAWWSLEASDAPPERFAPLLASAAASGWGLDVAAPDGAAPADHVAALLEALERAPVADRVLVLDDVHELGSAPEAFALLRGLLDRLPNGVAVLLVSRVDPDLPLARWHLEGRLDRVGTDDLRFLDAEAAELLAALGVALRPALVRTLVQRTEGWGAGLHLAALGLRGRAPDAVTDFVERFTGTDPYVLAYLAEEVLQRLPPGLQDFLLRVSVADVLDVPTAVVLGGRPDAAELLAEAERAHLFLHQVGAAARTVRFHASFRELLRRRLADADPRLAAELRARVAGRPTTDAEPLTDREREVLRWLATGASNDAIAGQLQLSPNTVKTHLKRLFEKLDVGTRTAAVARARDLDLL
ncbi:MAG: LuxR C-terminal-related transcriptional regulator [Trueperaceae bacterium]